MCRIAIVGPPGSGKTTLARHLGALLELPVHHLDAHFWQPGWRKVSDCERARILGKLLAGEEWIIEGSYLHCQATLIACADVVLVLATPRLVCMWRVLRRHWTRAERADLPQGCRDRLSLACMWKIATYSDRRARAGAIKYPQTREENAMIRKVENVYVISSHQAAIPGCYDSERAAKYAFRFPDEALQQLQDEVNEREPDYNKRVITFEMLQALARKMKAE